MIVTTFSYLWMCESQGRSHVMAHLACIGVRMWVWWTGLFVSVWYSVRGCEWSLCPSACTAGPMSTDGSGCTAARPPSTHRTIHRNTAGVVPYYEPRSVAIGFVAERGTGENSPSKFWAVEKLTENPIVGRFSSFWGRKTAFLGKFRANPESWSPIISPVGIFLVSVEKTQLPGRPLFDPRHRWPRWP